MMDGTNLFLIILHFVLLPMVFFILRYLRIEEIFKRQTPPQVITLVYFALTIAITQLIIQFFTTVFALIDGLF